MGLGLYIKSFLVTRTPCEVGDGFFVGLFVVCEFLFIGRCEGVGDFVVKGLCVTA